jgi:hypothetical protein
MTTVLGHDFSGPHSIDAEFQLVPGVYIIADFAGNVVDVGETGALGNRIPAHERRPGWSRYGGTKLWFHHQPVLAARLRLEGAIRDHFNPPCGER